MLGDYQGFWLILSLSRTNTSKSSDKKNQSHNLPGTRESFQQKGVEMLSPQVKCLLYWELKARGSGRRGAVVGEWGRGKQEIKL